VLRITIAMSDDWMDFAACKGEDPDIFFCDETDPDAVEQAKEICRSCPVVEPCLESSMSITFGVWAGLTSRERRFVRMGM
jgi:WhiB family redox-sensing transcriptional regulator